jgi:hypothetical protein
MEKTRSERIKELLLAGFVTICVALIFALWFGALSNKSVETPYFYRGEPTTSGSFYLTRTAIAESALLGTGTPTPEEKKHPEKTPTPMPIPTLPFTPEADT